MMGCIDEIRDRIGRTLWLASWLCLPVSAPIIRLWRRFTGETP